MRYTSLLLLGGSALSAAWVVPNQQTFADIQTKAEATVHHGLDELKAGLGAAIHAAEGAQEQVETWVENAAENPFVDHPHSDKTIYEMLQESKYTTKFAKLIEKNEKFKDLLDKKDANVTVFVPPDHAFEKIPDHAKDPPKEWVEALLNYHIVPGTFDARHLFGVTTLPTLLEGGHLSDKPSETPQRLSVSLGLRGLWLNNYNRIIYRDIFASNGVVHATKTFNIPPPPLGAIVSFVPTAFSQFELGLFKSGLGHIGHAPHLGATVFAPANPAWKKLGFRANAFLFSHWGKKYLNALLRYHIVANQTLYSDEFYGPGKDEATSTIPKGRAHLDLPTLLEGKSVGVDVGRYGRFVDIHVNHYSKVVAKDIIGHDGNIHVINAILIPPHHKKTAAQADYDGGEIDVEDLMERLEPFVNESDCDHDQLEL